MQPWDSYDECDGENDLLCDDGNDASDELDDDGIESTDREYHYSYDNESDQDQYIWTN